MIRIFAAAACAAVLALPAIAECPAGAVQTMVNLDISVAKAPDAEAIGAQADTLAASCVSDAYVQRVAAMTHMEIVNRSADAAKAFAHAAKAWGYVTAMHAVAPPNEKDVMVMVNGAPTAVRLYDMNDNFDQEALFRLIQTEMASGSLIPDHQPLKPSEKVRACGGYDPSHVQYAARIASDNAAQDVPPILNFMDRMAKACDPTKSNNRNIIALRARLLVKMVKANPKRPDATALLDKALADSKRFFEIKPDGDIVYWSKSEAEELTALSNQMRGIDTTPPLPPEADWLKTGNTENPKVIAALAAKLDDAWAIDEPLGASAGYKTYRAVLSRLMDDAYKSGNVAAAKHALALAAKGHSDGSMRKPANKALKPPPSFLWNWLDPEVKPTL